MLRAFLASQRLLEALGLLPVVKTVVETVTTETETVKTATTARYLLLILIQGSIRLFSQFQCVTDRLFRAVPLP